MLLMVDADRAAVEGFFDGLPLGLAVYDEVARRVDLLGPASARVTKSQVAFRRRTGFCWVWRPGMYLAKPQAEVVVSIGLFRADASPRWKEVRQVTGRRWMHHLEVGAVSDLDDEVGWWLREAYAGAG